ncbi:Pycsar system effector family protein [Tenacibaculum finnmarkense]|uniref:Pycsar system effector family protein n=1 Tax=Tenacibaculum finnmarkense TaxID=2781243 RepID=UPI00187BB021|nr:Pycsar system effector family protein [Tenacibaculum finnmarkense]MBE7645973.1 HD domain-containing protein [Tenacibaculum finnmarkense genomovar ulcerans]MCG8238847.1 HD domain-containing protein [Tenacibaculum finnmarkense genomovar ulcerans]
MENLLIEAENFVITLLNEKLDTSFIYHNVFHTQRVVAKTKELIKEVELTVESSNSLLLAAWFHDTGYTESIENHEEESVKIVTVFLKDKGVSQAIISEVSQLILATKICEKPQNNLEKIIKDADCAHLGSKNFSDYTLLLRKEWELSKQKVVSDKKWLEENIQFLTKHRFYTDFAVKNWSKIASKNLAELLKNQQKLQQENKKLQHKKEELAFKKNKVELPERGIETMFRVALRNHITLSDIADTKANILLSVNAIIISMSLSTLIPKLDNPTNHYLIIPSLIFILFTVASIILSIIATRPNVTQGKFTKEDVANKKVNLLFFGNFHQMNLPDFEWAMHEMMKDRDYLYGSLTKDLYFLGLVLNRKYKLLRVTYTVFMIGIIVSVLAFSIAFQLQEMKIMI